MQLDPLWAVTHPEGNVAVLFALLAFCVLALTAVACGWRVGCTPTMARATAPDEQASGEDALPSSFRVLCQNMWLHTGLPTPRPQERLEALVAHIEAADPPYSLLCFQEVFIARLGALLYEKRALWLRERMARLGYHCTRDLSASPCAYPLNSGMVVFSRVPFVSEDFAEFSYNAGELLCRKGYQHVQVLLQGGRRLHVFNTHFNSKSWPVRERQIDQLRMAVAGVPETDAVLIAGDFNTCSLRDPNHYYVISGGLRQHNLSPVFDHSSGTMRNSPSQFALLFQSISCGLYQADWKLGRDSEVALDHAFVSSHLKAMSQQVLDLREEHDRSRPVSDHLGLSFIVSS